MFKKRKYYFLFIAVPILIFGYNISSNDKYKKLKTFTEVLRLVNDNYFEDGMIGLMVENGSVRTDAIKVE